MRRFRCVAPFLSRCCSALAVRVARRGSRRMRARSPALLRAAPAATLSLGLWQRGPVYAALAALAGGLLVSLTPCVYPMIAVTVSVFGAREAESRCPGHRAVAAFVLGIVAMFVPLGSGGGSHRRHVRRRAAEQVGHPRASASLFLAMAASMFGAFEFTLPSGLTNRLATIGRHRLTRARSCSGWRAASSRRPAPARC